VLVQRRVRAWWLLVPLAAAAWALVHASGIHATVAGVLLGFAVPVRRRSAGPGPGLAEHFEHRFRPISAGFAVPVFAFFAAGVSVVDGAGIPATLADPVTQGVVAGLVVGKPIGVLAATWLTQRLTRARLAEGISWWDVLGLAHRDRLHGLVADRRARVRHGHRGGGRRQDRRVARLVVRDRAGRRGATDPQRPLPAPVRRSANCGGATAGHATRSGAVFCPWAR
jgi:hypothetical protein